MARSGGIIEVVFQIVSGYGKSVRGPERRISVSNKDERTAQQQGSKATHEVRLSGAVLRSQNTSLSAQKNFCKSGGDGYFATMFRNNESDSAIRAAAGDGKHR